MTYFPGFREPYVVGHRSILICHLLSKLFLNLRLTHSRQRLENIAIHPKLVVGLEIRYTLTESKVRSLVQRSRPSVRACLQVDVNRKDLSKSFQIMPDRSLADIRSPA